MASPRIILFDCDSTLSAIEGIDELARLRGPEVFAQVEAQTMAAMEGKIPVEEVFGRRLALIRPHRAEVDRVGQLYVEQVEPTAKATINACRTAGWTPMILSGGFRPVIAPLAVHLGIARVEAVDIFFDSQGNYAGFDETFPTTRSGGKPECITRLRRELSPSRLVMVGDGVSDLETKPAVDLFVGFGRYTTRARVRAEAHEFITSLDQLPALLR
ncbi:MAG: HAD-IB family phosphatase [Opitutae bacterium]